MAKTFTLTIARVDQPVFVGSALSVAVPGLAGDMVILAEHEPLISPLKAGLVRYLPADGSEQQVEISSGTLEVARNQATILVS